MKPQMHLQREILKFESSASSTCFIFTPISLKIYSGAQGLWCISVNREHSCSVIILGKIKLNKRFGEQEFVRLPSGLERDGELQLLRFAINKFTPDKVPSNPYMAFQDISHICLNIFIAVSQNWCNYWSNNSTRPLWFLTFQQGLHTAQIWEHQVWHSKCNPGRDSQPLSPKWQQWSPNCTFPQVRC